MKCGLVRTALVTVIALAVCGATAPEAAHPIRVFGTLERVEGTELVLKLRHPKDGQAEAAVPTDADTLFNVDGDLGVIGDLRPGMGISARDENVGVGDTKLMLMVMAKSVGVFGTLVKVDGTTLTLQVLQPGGDPKSVDVQTDEKTRVVFVGLPHNGTAPPTLADLKPGMHVRAVPDTGVAKKIIATPAPA